VSLYRIVIDTNVLIAALRSRRGASHRMLMLVGTGRFEISVSVPLVLEYEYAAKALLGAIPLTESDIDDILDYLCQSAVHTDIYYLWRPLLRDPKDDMVLELAVAAGCDFIVTYNQRDFRGAGRLGIQVATAKEFLQKIGELP
jgi:putative PIN family toxin of toxin-antitoxin system